MRLKTELDDRVLRFDGVSVIEPDGVTDLLMLGVKPTELRVTRLDEDLDRFNDRVDLAERILCETNEPIAIDLDWRLPDEYLQLDLWTAVSEAFTKRSEALFERYAPEQRVAAVERLAAELQEIERRGMVEFMKTIIYILDVFRKNNVVWGVGRGSSCASYVLFVLGLHAVDCVLYNVPMIEFYHD